MLNYGQLRGWLLAKKRRNNDATDDGSFCFGSIGSGTSDVDECGPKCGQHAAIDDEWLEGASTNKRAISLITLRWSTTLRSRSSF
jgi:hypothetical protein